MPARFFLRFYDMPQGKVEEIAKEFKTSFPKITSFKVMPLTRSVNAIVPPDSHEMHLMFRTKADRDAVYNNAAAKALYLKHQYPGAEFCAQSETSKSYVNPIVAGGM